MSFKSNAMHFEDPSTDDKNLDEDEQQAPIAAFKIVDGRDKVGLALLEQKNVIPTTGKRIPTSKLEYWTFCMFCEFLTLIRVILRLLGPNILSRLYQHRDRLEPGRCRYPPGALKPSLS